MRKFLQKRCKLSGGFESNSGDRRVKKNCLYGACNQNCDNGTINWLFNIMAVKRSGIDDSFIFFSYPNRRPFHQS